MTARLMRRATTALAALTGTAILALSGQEARAQQPDLTIGEMELLRGPDSGGDWYGYRASNRHFLINDVSDEGLYRYYFRHADFLRAFTINADILEFGGRTRIGVFCCDQGDGSAYFAYLLDADGSVSGWEVDPQGGQLNIAQELGDGHIVADGTWFEMTETPNGMEIAINGNTFSSWSSPDLRMGQAGLIVWGTGIFAVDTFDIYVLPDDQPDLPQEVPPEPEPGGSTLFR